MTRLARAMRYLLAPPDKILMRIIKSSTHHGTAIGDGKISVDENGNLSLNPNNKEVQESFLANVKVISGK
ncbi:hypothetical protein [Photorhabdus namnaonensis]|uniref:Uncharacterized protein n=1 Tax=Photorhabdus namnaonensis TaxID=1851568 RepID=A0A1B8YDI3_9GAMM|nr:hypothetical protein [Photorhabdus namnaonensis]OCA53102.1 hypothetical protein Phpb_04154 [Photorhabdus namnaonensis]